MKTTLTIIFALTVTLLSAQKPSTKASQFAVIDFPKSIVSVTESNNNILLLENWMSTKPGVHILNKQSGKISFYPLPENTPCTDLKVGPDGDIYYVVNNQGLYLYNPATSSSKLVWDQYKKGRSYTISFSPDNSYILLSGNDNVLLRKFDYSEVTRFANVVTRKNIVQNSGTVWNMGVTSVSVYVPGDSLVRVYSSDKYDTRTKLVFDHGETNDLVVANDNYIYLLVNANIYRTPVNSPGHWTLVSTYGNTENNMYVPNNLLVDKNGNLYLTVKNKSNGFLPLGKALPAQITYENAISSTHIKQPFSYASEPFPIGNNDICGILDMQNLFFLSNDNRRMTIYSPESDYKPLMGKYTSIKPY